MQLRIENAYYQPGASRRGLQGFLGTEIARYQVLETGLQLLSTESMPNRPPADPPADRLITPLVAHARFYRLYFEVIFNHIDHTQGSVLLAAASPAELSALAAQLDRPESVCGPGAPHCTAFPEACTVSVEIDVIINGRSSPLIWGSSLASVTGEHPHRVSLQRLADGHLTPVKLDPHDPAALHLPLLPGDSLHWR